MGLGLECAWVTWITANRDGVSLRLMGVKIGLIAIKKQSGMIRVVE